MSIPSIPGLSFAIRQSLDRLLYQHEVYNLEFIERLKLAIGHPDYITNIQYGIVSQTDPGSALDGDSLPLTVSHNSTETLTVDINPGMAVTQSGVWIKLDTKITQRSLDDTSVGIPNVVYLKYVLGEANLEVNDYDQPIIPYTVRPGWSGSSPAVINMMDQATQVYVDRMDAYLNLSADIRANCVPLAIVTVQTNSSYVNVLSIDHTQTAYTWNRPWFSVQDLVHRNQLGTGVQSPENPHAQSQNDLSVGAFSAAQLEIDHGMIIADDQSIAKQPGYRCSETKPYALVKTDDALGTYTSFANKKYIELQAFPVRLGKVWAAPGGVEQELATLKVEETNRVVFAGDDPPVGEDINVYYTRVIACEPPVGNSEANFTTANPTANELVLSGGLYKIMLASTVEDFSDAQKFPMEYSLLVDGSGDLFKAPQVIYCYRKLSDFTPTDTFTISQYGPARIMMGLTGASGIVSLKIRLYGKNLAGSSINYLFEFDNTWAEPAPAPSYTSTTVTPAAVKVSDVVFASVSSISIEEQIGVGADGAIVMWALINPFDTYDKLKDACHIADVMWDALRLCKVRDKRIIGTTVRDFMVSSPGLQTMHYLANLLAGGNSTIYVEDFRNPKYHNQVPNTDIANTYQYCNSIYNLSKLRVGSQWWYTTRALPVRSGSGVLWRVVLTPVDEARTGFPVPITPPSFYYFTGGAWQPAVTMTAVAGLNNTYECTLASVPTRIKVSLAAADYQGMLIFG